MTPGFPTSFDVLKILHSSRVVAKIAKTTIARTMVEYAKEKKIWNASFFFSRDDAVLSNALLVFSTLAY